MANALDALIDRIPDEALRGQIREALKKQNQQKKFGLVFEDHIPESTVLYDVPVKAGSTVALRGGDVSKQMKVLAIDGEVAHCLSLPEREPVDQPLDSLVSVAKFGEPIYPYLKQLDTVCNAPDSDLWHTLIEADNYHALQLLEYLYAEKVDCIYIDPPYNTGEDEWKYNDAFVDKNDQWQHSKWLSFIKKRLKIAKRLLNPKGVLIISIGHQQINRLNLLLEELFPEKQIVTVTVQTSGGKPSGGFNYLQEYLVFIVPKDFEPMQTVFSIVTAVLLGAAAIFADHRGNIPTLFFIISISIIIATIGASLVLSSIVQWRFKTQVLPDLSELRKYTFESDEWESITGKTAQQKQYYQLLQDVQTEKCRLNDRRVRLIIASIICFWASIAESVIAFIIGLYLITI